MKSGRRPGRTLIRAAVVADGAGLNEAPGAVLIDADQVVAAGRPQSVGQLDGVSVVELPGSAVIPALVNAHAHLDLTHMGPMSYDGAFTSWVNRVRSGRARDDAGIAAAVRKGVQLALAGGTAMIGDIAGVRSLAPLETLRREAREHSLRGVSFLEVFGLGRTQPDAIDRMQASAASVVHDDGNIRLGLQPHAPYSCGPEVYRAAAALRLPLATHLAETPEELQFVDAAAGPLAEMLRSIGVWDDSIFGRGVHPIDFIAELWSEHPFIAAHVNYADDRHIEALAKLPVSVAYCPRASAYFGHRCLQHGEISPDKGEGGHRYREMLIAGINVCLGTDSIICLDTADRLSVLDEMRLLFRRDGTPPAELLRMATVNGARALKFDASLVTLAGGRIAGLLHVPLPEGDGPPLERMLRGDAPPCWLMRGDGCVPGPDELQRSGS